MEIYNTFVDAFHNEVHHSKKRNGHSDLRCRNSWGFDAARLIRKLNKPHTKTFFRYCQATGKCPAQLFITLIKDHINLNELNNFIQNELKSSK